MATVELVHEEQDAAKVPVLRETLKLPRSLEFFSESELTKQISYPRYLWRQAMLKEMIDKTASSISVEQPPCWPQCKPTAKPLRLRSSEQLAGRTLKDLRQREKRSSTRGQLGLTSAGFHLWLKQHLRRPRIIPSSLVATSLHPSTIPSCAVSIVSCKSR
jgi:hypothetical protein